MEAHYLTKQVAYHPLLRLYIYGLHGVLTEIVYTSCWHLIMDKNIKLQGYTSVWAFFIYALSTFFIERLYFRLKDHVPMPVRGVIYCKAFKLHN